ncbi:MAG: radical SAM/SPASM domain-containing protein [Archaeoglobales archaeon]|nr:MAG: radical SAM/SPASM domain-containing protein [Archaeoglobales archaeon]
MDTGKMVEFFSVTVNNPVTKMVIKRTLKKEEGSTKLEYYLKAFAEGKDIGSVEYKIIKSVIKTGLKIFGGKEEELKERLRDAYWRRGFVNVLTGLVEFGVRKPFVPGAPFLIVWDLTYACNLRCKHCYATAGKAWKDELTTEEALKALDVLGDAGVTAIAFSGGEPLLRRDFTEIASYASSKGMFVAVATNGTLLTREKVEELKNAGVGFVQISLDGTKETHEAFRGISGIYEKVIEGIKNTIESGLITCISTTATKFNKHDIIAIMDMAEELGVEWFMLYNFVPTGRGDFEMDLDCEEREKLLKELWRRLKTTGINFMSTAPYYARIAMQEESSTIPTHFYNPTLEGRLRSLAEFIGGCGCGRFYIAIRANGNIEPCVFFPLTLDNIKNFESGEDFLRFWKENEVLNMLRDKDSIEICGECRYRYVCGGCRARAYAYTGDFMKADPGCIIAEKRIKKAVKAKS